MKVGDFFAQGDIIIEKVRDIPVGSAMNIDPDGAIVLARGEVTGHRHAFYGGNVTMFRANEGDGGLGDLYIGHIKVADAKVDLRHEEHNTITLPKGTYRIRRQREFDAGMARIVAD